MLGKISTFSMLIFALFAAGCGDDDNPVDHHDADDHAEAIGLIIRNSGEEIVRYENGQVQGEIEVGHGKETALLSVRFIPEDSDSEPFTPDGDDGYSLDWEIGNESIAEIEHHPEDGTWAFHIVGLEEGKTYIVLKINHNGHADFVSKEIEIHVEEDGPGEVHDEDHDEEEDESSD